MSFPASGALVAVAVDAGRRGGRGRCGDGWLGGGGRRGGRGAACRARRAAGDDARAASLPAHTVRLW